MRDMLASHPDEPGHGGWYVVVDGRLIGIRGFKGPPNQWGEAEIGYSVMRSYRRKGSRRAPSGFWRRAASAIRGSPVWRPGPCRR